MGSWDSLYDQICASNNFALSGMPYWSQVCDSLISFRTHF